VANDTDDVVISSFHQIGLSVGKSFEWQNLDDDMKRGLARAVKTGEQIVDSKWAAAGETTNGWKYKFAGGRAGFDPGLRAALAKYEVGARLCDQVIFLNTSEDEKGEALTGANKYALHFDAKAPAGDRAPGTCQRTAPKCFSLRMILAGIAPGVRPMA
jgi:hypothetical protein